MLSVEQTTKTLWIAVVVLLLVNNYLHYSNTKYDGGGSEQCVFTLNRDPFLVLPPSLSYNFSDLEPIEQNKQVE